MDFEIKRQWVEALRSGKYKQGRNYLHQDEKFCCLGVLCELVKEKFGLKMYRNSSDITYYEEEKHYLPKIIKEKLFNGEDVKVKISESDGPLARLSVADLNDRGFTFNEIADMIEEQL